MHGRRSQLDGSSHGGPLASPQRTHIARLVQRLWLFERHIRRLRQQPRHQFAHPPTHPPTPCKQSQLRLPAEQYNTNEKYKCGTGPTNQDAFQWWVVEISGQRYSNCSHRPSSVRCSDNHHRYGVSYNSNDKFPRQTPIAPERCFRNQYNTGRVSRHTAAHTRTKTVGSHPFPWTSFVGSFHCTSCCCSACHVWVFGFLGFWFLWFCLRLSLSHSLTHSPSHSSTLTRSLTPSLPHLLSHSLALSLLFYLILRLWVRL